MTKYFKPEEVTGLDKDFVALLDCARGAAGIPFVITSGYRTPEHNAELKGAVADSAHTTGHAVDIRVQDSHTLERTLYGLFYAGFHRIGLYFSLEGTKLTPRHIHVDDDTSKPSEVVWALIEQN